MRPPPSGQMPKQRLSRLSYRCTQMWKKEFKANKIYRVIHCKTVPEVKKKETDSQLCHCFHSLSHSHWLTAQTWLFCVCVCVGVHSVYLSVVTVIVYLYLIFCFLKFRYYLNLSTKFEYYLGTTSNLGSTQFLVWNLWIKINQKTFCIMCYFVLHFMLEL